jgi:hypothetical protein
MPNVGKRDRGERVPGLLVDRSRDTSTACSVRSSYAGWDLFCVLEGTPNGTYNITHRRHPARSLLLISTSN